MLGDKRFWIYHWLIVTIISTLLAIEDVREGQNMIIILREFAANQVVFFLLVIAISWIVFMVVGLMNRLMPWDTGLFKRLFTEFLFIVMMIVVFTTITTHLAKLFGSYNPDGDDDFDFEYLALVMYFITITKVFAFHEVIALSITKEALRIRAELLQKQNYLAKYEALKNQVNPHFLFNSLNVLSSPIYRDVKQSDQFIRKFADVFRYVLELHQEKLVPVKIEVRFLESYLFLQQIRYGSHLKIEYRLDTTALQKFIPPLSLQLVIENALKHNVISDECNLHIFVENNEKEIIVRNNYQIREASCSSTGIGQPNLIEKYRLLGGDQPRFYLENDFYFARLPLLNSLTW